MANCPLDQTVLTEVDSSFIWTVFECSNCKNRFIEQGNLLLPVSTFLKLATKTPVNAVAATGKITIAVGQPSDADYVTINGRKYTFKTALSLTPTAYEVLIGAQNTDTATNLQAAITFDDGAGTNEGVLYGTGTVANAYVTASVNTNVVTVTSLIKGVIGNSYTLVKSGANITLSGSVLGTGAGTTAGVDSTSGKKWEMYVDASYVYVCVADTVTSSTNWRRMTLGSAY